jgi:WD40 repeat protein
VFLTWTQDSRYVIASNCGFFRRWIHLWNAQTGRHVADFATQSRLGTLTSVEGIGVGCGGRKLFAASADGRVLRWDLSDAVKAIGDLEAEVSGTVSAKTGKE